MRDFRDAKAMATSLRQALSDKSVTVTHSESLELVAKAFGLDNWNILAAKIEAGKPRPEPAETEPTSRATALYCSFCGKSQYDVLTLIAGPTVFICNECVGLCDGIMVDKQLEKALAEARAERPDAPALEAASDLLGTYADNQLQATLKSCADWLGHINWSLTHTAAALAGEERAPWRPDETALTRGWTRDPLKDKSREEIAAQHAHMQTLQAQVRERVRLLEQILAAREAALA